MRNTINLRRFQYFRDLHLKNAGDKPRDWYRISNLAGDEAEVYIYDVIGATWFGGITADEFVRDLNSVTASKVYLRINSPGGDIWDATAMYNAIRNHPATFEAHIDGVAASAASWVGLAAEKVVMEPHATMMIHDPWSIVMGNAVDMRKEADVLDMYAEEIAGMYHEKAGHSVQYFRDLMREETWFTDRKAVEVGLADEVAPATKADSSSSSNSFDHAILSIFANTPADLLKSAGTRTTNDAPSKRDAERALRDAGFSRAQAEALVSTGWHNLAGAQWDADAAERLLADLRR